MLSLPPSRYRRVLQQARSRQGRRKSQFFVCEGFRCCREALRRQPEAVEAAIVDGSLDAGGVAELRELADLCESGGIEWVDLEPKVFSQYPLTRNPQGIILLCKRDSLPQKAAGERDPFILVLDGLSDPGNLGTILRTAQGVGLREVWYTRGSADPFNPKSVRAGMGAQFSLAVREFAEQNILQTTLHDNGITRTWITSPRTGISCYGDDFELRDSALVVGNEAHGPELVVNGDHVHIPMPGDAESLNVAQATAIFLFEGVRRGII